MSTTTRARPAALNVTPNATERIRELMAKAPEGTVGVRLSTPKRGCSGLAYSVAYVADASPMDERIETPGGILFVDSGSLRTEERRVGNEGVSRVRYRWTA